MLNTRNWPLLGGNLGLANLGYDSRNVHSPTLYCPGTGACPRNCVFSHIRHPGQPELRAVVSQ